MEKMQHNPDDREWHGLGERAEVTPERQLAAESEFDKRIAYATKSQTHLWIITLCHYASDNTLDALTNPDSEHTPMLDTETLAMRPALGCFICESPYEPRLRLRKCPGEPR